MSKCKKIVIVCIIGIFCLALAACGGKVKADISSYEDTEIKVIGITDNELSVTPSELKELSCENKSVSTKSNGKDISADASGPTLETFIKEYGYEIKDIERVTFKASDGYTKEFDSDFFVLHPELILSLADGDKPLKRDQRPVRLIIPDTMADQWVKGVIEIDFTIK